MKLKELKALVEALEYDMACTSCDDSEIAFIQYDDSDEKAIIDYYDNDSTETIRYTYSLRWMAD